MVSSQFTRKRSTTELPHTTELPQLTKYYIHVYVEIFVDITFSWGLHSSNNDIKTHGNLCATNIIVVKTNNSKRKLESCGAFFFIICCLLVPSGSLTNRLVASGYNCLKWPYYRISGIFRNLQIFEYTPHVRKLKRRNIIRVYTVVLHVAAYPNFKPSNINFNTSKFSCTRYTVCYLKPVDGLPDPRYKGSSSTLLPSDCYS